MRDEFYFMNSRAHPRISTLRGFPRLRKFRHFWARRPGRLKLQLRNARPSARQLCGWQTSYRR